MSPKQGVVTFVRLVQSLISYGLPFWGSAYNIHINKLKVTINLLLKFIFFTPKYYFSINIFNDYYLSNLDTSYSKKNYVFMFKNKELIEYIVHTWATKYNSSS